MKLSASYLLWYGNWLQGAKYRHILDDDDRRRRDRRMPRVALKRYIRSSFRHLYLSGNEQALLNCTGCNHHTFFNLLAKFEPYFDLYTFEDGTGIIRLKKVDKNGNVLGMKRDMTAEGCLGLILMWYRTRGSCARSLAMHFGQTSTPMYKWLKFGRRILLVCLMDDPDARVTVPTLADVRRYQKAIGDKYPLVGDVWGAADGLKLGVESSGNYAIQNMYYNGWTHGHYINNIFVFACDGKIRISLQNCPGTFHDSTMSDYGVYDKMEQLYRSTGGKVVVDSAFKIPTGNFLIKSSQTDPVNARELLINRQATSVRQLSEWGM